MKQFCRIYLDAGGAIVAAHTQTTPINFQPVEDPQTTEVCALELSGPVDHFVTADLLLDHMKRKPDGAIGWKADAPEAVRKEITSQEVMP